MTRRGVTLVELILAMMITALLSAGVASMLYAAGYGTSSRREVRRVAVKSLQLQKRFEDAIRSARAVLASGQVATGYGFVVLWTGDTNADDQVNLSELQLIELPNGTTTLQSCQPSPSATDVTYPADANFYSVAQTAKASGNLVPVTWSNGISDLTVTLDNPTPVMARLVTWRLTLTDQAISEQLCGAANLRSPSSPQ